MYKPRPAQRHAILRRPLRRIAYRRQSRPSSRSQWSITVSNRYVEAELIRASSSSALTTVSGYSLELTDLVSGS